MRVSQGQNFLIRRRSIGHIRPGPLVLYLRCINTWAGSPSAARSAVGSELALRKGRLYRAAWDDEVMAGYIGS